MLAADSIFAFAGFFFPFSSDLINEACDVTKRADLAAIVMQEGLAYVWVSRFTPYLLHSYLTFTTSNNDSLLLPTTPSSPTPYYSLLLPTAPY